MDRYQIFGVATLILSLLLILAFTQGLERVLYLGGVFYSAAFIFHSPIRRSLVPSLRRPLLAYRILVVVNGLIVETLAYVHNLPKIQRGEPVFLFAASSLWADLLMGLPYYLSFAFLFSWLLRRFDFSTFEFTFMVGLAQALTTDQFSHVVPLVAGGLAGVLGFIYAAFTMLFTLNVPYVWFEERFREAYPNRNRSWIKFPIGMGLQLIPLAITFVLVFLRYNVLHL